MGEWPVAEVEKALQHVQTFDPIGVAARDLQECLWLQLRHLGLEGTPSEKIVTEHLRLLQNHQVPEIARKLGMPIEELKQHIEIIRNLDPKPGSRYNPLAVAVRDSRRLRGQGRGSVRRDAQRRRASAAAHQPGLPPAARQERPDRHRGSGRDARLREGQVPLGALADQVGRPAPEDHPQGRDQHHQLPARVPRSGHRVPAAAGPARRRQRHRDARVDGQPGGEQQVHAHAARACSR